MLGVEFFWVCAWGFAGVFVEFGGFLFFWGVGFVGTLGKFVILSLLQKGENPYCHIER